MAKAKRRRKRQIDKGERAVGDIHRADDIKVRRDMDALRHILVGV